MESGSWSDLLPELLELILSRLPLSCHPHFGSVCKSWNEVVSLVYPADISPLLARFKEQGDSVLRFWSPSLNKTFKVNFPFDLANARLYSSRDGFLVLYRKYEVILANPAYSFEYKFPGLHYPNNFTNITFAGCPPNDCIIFVIESKDDRFVKISVWNNKKGWDENKHFDNNHAFVIAPRSNPVPCDGYFCCLGKGGNLGIYDPVNDTWTVYTDPPRMVSYVDESYLVEVNDDLLAILFGKEKLPIQILQLNKGKMVWEERNMPLSHTLFIGPGISLLTHGCRKMEDMTFRSRPETIQAEMVMSEGRLFFKSKLCTHHKTGEPLKKINKDKGGICSCSLESGGKRSENHGTIDEYPSCVWYDPRYEPVFDDDDEDYGGNGDGDS